MCAMLPGLPAGAGTGGRGHRSSRCLSPPQGEKVDVDMATPWPSHDTRSTETLEQSQET